MPTTDGLPATSPPSTPSSEPGIATSPVDIAMHSVRIEETTDGWRLLFRAANDLALLPSVANWIALERRCCPFPHFRVVLTPTALWLELGGPVGVKSFRI